MAGAGSSETMACHRARAPARKRGSRASGSWRVCGSRPGSAVVVVAGGEVVAVLSAVAALPAPGTVWPETVVPEPVVPETDVPEEHAAMKAHAAVKAQAAVKGCAAVKAVVVAAVARPGRLNGCTREQPG